MGCVKLHILDQQYKNTELKVSYINKKLTLKNSATNQRKEILIMFVDPDGMQPAAVKALRMPKRIKALWNYWSAIRAAKVGGAVAGGWYLGNYLSKEELNTKAEEVINSITEGAVQNNDNTGEVSSSSSATNVVPDPNNLNESNNNKKNNDNKDNLGSRNTAKGDKMGSNTRANKQIDDISKKYNINRKEFGKYVEKSKTKEGKKGADNYTWKELEKMAKTYKEKQK